MMNTLAALENQNILKIKFQCLVRYLNYISFVSYSIERELAIKK